MKTFEDGDKLASQGVVFNKPIRHGTNMTIVTRFRWDGRINAASYGSTIARIANGATALWNLSIYSSSGIGSGSGLGFLNLSIGEQGHKVLRTLG